ncbi:MAG: glycerol-3-phosphate acyltransferase, partial [Candidatus Dadabacteria bacterium]|nr:glycerol-3-phosphate acyltransferase [Candidatus Dadabacteria bacterium]
MIEVIILTLFAYLLGSIPTAYILGNQFFGKDIRKLGNGNVGTVNAWHEFGWRTGIMVLILDMAKGAMVMALILVLGVT